MSRRQLSSLRTALVPWLVLALLLAQGLQLCIPAETTPGHETHAAMHLESAITSAADQHESDSHEGDLDLQLAAVLKGFQVHPLLLSVFAITLPVLLLFSTGFSLRPHALTFRPVRGHRFTPPLRAPPR